MTRIIKILVLFLPLGALADNSVNDNPVTLSVKPVLCIVDQRTRSCDMAFRIAWKSQREGYYCLSCDLDNAPLRCWTEARAGEFDDRRSVLEDFSYMISEDDSQLPIETVTVEVVRMDSDDRRRRRRARHVWDRT
jgi:hypothetical protein